ncbi:hypothetical protein ACRQ5Q_14835 [Bradyrhizobium sp. PMVTL-01]|uniref:hypothetical protein n=1 Tax=Bradyrhizobium sp. PMVTL-01 TaxID=3434999 RepID=UPI003F6F6286
MSSSAPVGDPPISTSPVFECPTFLPPEFSRPVGVSSLGDSVLKLGAETFVDPAAMIAARGPTITTRELSDPFERLPALAARLNVKPTTNNTGIKLHTKDGQKFDLIELVGAALDRLDGTERELRDAFAAQAMGAMVERYIADGGDNLDHVAVVAYQFADAMMAARKGGRS